GARARAARLRCGDATRSHARSPQGGHLSTRIYVIPDTQIRPGDVTDHLDWIAQDIVRRKPDWLCVMGDWFDLPSLSSHDPPGSLAKEDARLLADLEAGRAGFKQLVGPIDAELERIARRRIKRWHLRREFFEGNHEWRAHRLFAADPRLEGVVGTHLCDVENFGFRRHKFLEPFAIEGVHFAHYWQNALSSRPIGGTIDNRLNKLCCSFVCGHEQGLKYGNRPLPMGRTIHGIVAGSCYLGTEEYRGPQARNEWRGVVVLNDVRDGDFEPMPLTLRYLCEEYTGEALPAYLRKRYPDRDWSHLD
ncbi:hypothetical protein K2Z84_21390, partial [Candidatus Binatia bacterium]|nr:hypothetical protein [Candidatus Binatia bacterium]